MAETKRPTTRGGLLCPQVTDHVTSIETGQTYMIRGFYREAEPRETTPGRRLLVPCAPFHDDLCLLRLTGEMEHEARPWRFKWAGPAAWAQAVIDRDIALYYGSVCETHNSSLVDIGPQSTVRLNPPLSAHERLALAAWRKQTHLLIKTRMDADQGRTIPVRLA